MAIPKHPFMKISMAGSKATMDFFGSIMSDDEPEMDDNGKPVPGVKFGAYKAAIDGMKAEGVTDLDLLINTPGGDIVSGLAMYDLNKSCGLNIDMTVIGMCASMGTVMICSGSQLPLGTPGSLYMFHKPKAGEMGEASKLRESADLLDKMEERIMSIYCEAFGKEESEVKKWMKPGVNKWMTAKEAEDNGIIRGIAERPAHGQTAPANLTKPNARMSAAEMFKKFSQSTTEKPNMTLPKLTLGKLNLTADADDNDVNAAIINLITDKEAAEAKVLTLEKEKKDEFTKRAEMRADKAIAAKVWLAAEKKELVDMLMANFAGTEKMLEKIKPAGNITAQMRIEAGGEDTSTFQMTDAEKKYTMRDWEKKNAKKLAKMKVEAFDEVYAPLYEEAYGVAPKK